ncbi:Protein of unknown function [Flavobacterium resistens]|uniref:DUF4240 domain-containing protein n=1 Tax=Flavobacterium resistens TaxID=443612 RepID=A0A521CZ69_9FLAO|nr:DUF4240 domain-containing protein [Flavobacterium resistens]MRX67139.1 DUF4240 domain-containing protein [Flavobacterium resistens]SMO64724.1 Protein of unknown function [Flavobacterium resistens]
MGIFDRFFGKTEKEKNSRPIKTDFIISEKLMEEELFWKIIQKTKDSSGGNFEEQQEELANELRKLTADELILFGNSFRNFRGEANTWELWGAIYIIHGGCSDDSFNDFREWVIAQGKDFYYKITANPELLVETETHLIEEFDWEGFGYLPGIVFEELTGQEMPYPFQEKHNTTGNEWNEKSDDLQKMFPKLYAKYSANFQ